MTAGLLALAAAFGWIALSPAFSSYGQIVGQMVLIGGGLGLTTAPATESILSVLPPAKAGVGSAVNDATREAGGSLGVAVLGSVFTSLYAHHLAAGAFAALPQPVTATAQQSVGAALHTAATAPAVDQAHLLAAVQSSFMSGFHLACVVAAGICVLGAGAALALPGRPLPNRSVAAPAVVPVAGRRTSASARSHAPTGP